MPSARDPGRTNQRSSLARTAGRCSSELGAVMREQRSRELLAAQADEVEVRLRHCSKVCGVVPHSVGRDEVGNGNWQAIIDHSQVGVDKPVDEPSSGRLMETPTRCVLRPTMHNIEAAPQSRASEVAGRQRRTPAAASQAMM